MQLKGDRLLGQKPPPLGMTSRSSREKAADRANRQFPAVLDNFITQTIQSRSYLSLHIISLYIIRIYNIYIYIYILIYLLYVYLHIHMYICAYACACVCTYLPNGRAIIGSFPVAWYLRLVPTTRSRVSHFPRNAPSHFSKLFRPSPLRLS